MAETLALDPTLTKAAQYRQLLPQVEALTTGEPDLTANLANTAAALRQAFGFFWVGFYVVKGEELVLGPFQGPIACTRIRHGKGVCGASWARAATVLVPDVEAFPGHIACKLRFQIRNRGAYLQKRPSGGRARCRQRPAQRLRPRRPSRAGTAHATGSHLVLTTDWRGF